MKYSPDLIARVRSGLERAGFCFLSSDEIDRLLAGVPADHYLRHRMLLAFAEVCGAEVETTIHLKSARFVPARAEQRSDSDTVQRTIPAA